MRLLISTILLTFYIKQGFALALLDYDLDRVILSDQQKHQVLTVVNRGGNSGVYLINFLKTQMSEDGEVSISGDTQGYIKDEMIRVSPRKFFLARGGTQKIRILVKNVKQFNDSEYRSNLKILLKSNLDDKSVAEIEATDKVSIDDFKRVNADFAVSIPVFYNKDIMQNKMSVSDIKLSSLLKNNYEVSFTINRKGNSSTFGAIKIFLMRNGEQIELFSKNKKAIYYPNNLRNFKFSFESDRDLTLGDKIFVLYHNDEEILAKNFITL